MEWVETTGRTIEEAKEAALDELGVDEQDAEFQILEEPKLGLFGRIRSEGRVRARVRPTTPRAKEDRRDRRRRTRAASAASAADGTADGTAESAAETRPPATNGSGAAGRGDASATGGASGRPPATPGTPATVTAGAAPARQGAPAGEDGPGDADSATGPAPAAPRSRRRRRDAGDQDAGDAAETGAETDGEPSMGAGSAVGGRRAGPARAGGSRRQQRAPGEGAEAEDDRASEGETLMDVALQDQAEVARDFLSGLLARFGVEAQLGVTTSEEDERVELRVDGDNLGLLIGPKGSTLLAIQDLTRTYVQHRTSARNGRIHVDVAGYREKRAVALAAFVRKVAEDVTSSGKAVALEPMSAPDRKIVHDTAAQIGGLVTRSEGEDERRHVVLLPAPDGAGSPTDA